MNLCSRDCDTCKLCSDPNGQLQYRSAVSQQEDGKWEWDILEIPTGEHMNHGGYSDQRLAMVGMSKFLLERMQDRAEDDAKAARDEVDSEGFISIKWGIDDVLDVRPDLSEVQARDVLVHVKHTHDATLGVTWDTLREIACNLYGEAPEEDNE